MLDAAEIRVCFSHFHAGSASPLGSMRPARADEAAFLVLEVDPIRHVLHEEAEQAALPCKGLLHLLPFRDVVRDAECAMISPAELLRGIFDVIAQVYGRSG